PVPFEPPDQRVPIPDRDEFLYLSGPGGIRCVDHPEAMESRDDGQAEGLPAGDEVLHRRQDAVLRPTFVGCHSDAGTHQRRPPPDAEVLTRHARVPMLLADVLLVVVAITVTPWPPDVVEQHEWERPPLVAPEGDQSEFLGAGAVGVV